MKANDRARRMRNPIRAAVIDHDSGRMDRMAVSERPESMSFDKLQQALQGLELLDSHDEWTVKEYVTLSPRTPWVEGKGWLEAINVRSFHSNGPNMGWIPESGQPQGYLDIWLDNLQPNATYVAQIEVSSLGVGMFEVQAVALGAGQNVANAQANGSYQTLTVMIDTTQGGLAKIKVSNPDWIFIEAVISEWT